MRLSTLCASSAIAASLLLSACSTGTSSSIPGGSSVSSMGHVGPQFVVMARKDSASCPTSKYITCVDVTKASGGSVEICISTSGNCTSGLDGTWTWKSKITNLKGKPASKKIKNKWSPNPGNPSTDTFKEHGKIKVTGNVEYVANLTACNVSNPSSCLTGAVGLIPQ